MVLTAAFCRCAFPLLRSAAYAISRGMSAHAFDQAVENGVHDTKTLSYVSKSVSILMP